MPISLFLLIHLKFDRQHIVPIPQISSAHIDFQRQTIRAKFNRSSVRNISLVLKFSETNSFLQNLLIRREVYLFYILFLDLSLIIVKLWFFPILDNTTQFTQPQMLKVGHPHNRLVFGIYVI